MLAPTEIVIADVPAPGAGMVLGLKLTDVPLGTPLADRLIELLKLPIRLVVMLELPWFPCATESVDGEAVTVKSELLPFPWLIPRKEIGELSPVLAFVPTTTVNRVPVIVICLVTLLPGHVVADQALAASS